MNDPFELAGIGFKATEFKVIPPQFRAHVEGLFHNSVIPRLKETTGAVCFSRAWHNPVLWAHYADGHRGFCLEVDRQGAAATVQHVEFRLAAGEPEDGIEYTGVWVDERKIASIGVGVRRWVSYHGFAVNVTTESLLGFQAITPCGIGGIAMTALDMEARAPVGVDAFAKVVGKIFQTHLDDLLPRTPNA
jgi:hypothetical protein